MKSQGAMLLSVALGILKDASATYAGHASEFDRDVISLANGHMNRGLGFFTLDLPSLDDLLTSGLEAGQLSTSGPLSKRRRKGDSRPRMFFSLWCLVFDRSGRLLERADPTAIFFLRSLFCVGRKLSVPCSQARIETASYEYHRIESEMRHPTLDWSEDVLSLPTSHSGILSFDRMPLHAGSSVFPFMESHGISKVQGSTLRALDNICRMLACSFGEFNSIASTRASNSGKPSWGTRFRHGPGAVADLGNRAFKYDFPNWPLKLQGVFPYDWCGSSSPSFEKYPSLHEPSSVLLAVPKTAKGPRLIASEPTAHQWCQQGVLSWLLDQWSCGSYRDFIDFKDQTKSHDLVREASIHGDLATVDLSAASDRLSCWAIERAFGANPSLLHALHACRTRSVRDSVVPSRGHRVIKKFAAMGSALTFPIQSLFFLACCLASCGASSHKDILALKGKVRVYGDDLVIPVHAYEELVSLLDYLGLEVNRTKSFVRGNFRESCGLDCFKGFDVTPLKPKTLVPDVPQAIQATIDTANNFFRKGLWHASDAVRSTLSGFNIPIGAIDCGYVSYLTFMGVPYNPLRKKWNVDLQCWSFWVWGLRVSKTRDKTETAGNLLQYFTEEPDPYLFWTSGTQRNRRVTFSRRWEVDPGVVE